MTQATTIYTNLMASNPSKLNPHTSSKTEGFQPHLMRLLASVISQYLVRLFELTILTRIIQDDWRRAVVTTIHSKEARTNTVNYHPKSLLSFAFTKHLRRLKLFSLWRTIIWEQDWRHQDLKNHKSLCLYQPQWILIECLETCAGIHSLSQDSNNPFSLSSLINLTSTIVFFYSVTAPWCVYLPR